MDPTFSSTPGFGPGTAAWRAALGVALVLSGGGPADAQESPRYSLDLHLDPAGSTLTGTATVRPGPAQVVDGVARFDISVRQGRTMEILRVAVDGDGKPEGPGSTGRTSP